MKLDEVLKLGGSKEKGDVKGFFKDFHTGTEPNPFNPRMSVWKDSIGMEASELWGGVYLTAIMSFAKKNDGQASQALKWFCDLADKHKVTIYLSVKPIPNAGAREGKNLTKAELVKWYSRNGFVKKNSEQMERAPK